MEALTAVSTSSAGSVRKRVFSSSEDTEMDDIDTFSATPSPTVHMSKRSSKRVKKQLRLEQYKNNRSKKSPATDKLPLKDPILSNSEEDLLLASSDSNNECSQDTIMDPILSNSEEDLLLASSDSNNECSQDAIMSYDEDLNSSISEDDWEKAGFQCSSKDIMVHSYDEDLNSSISEDDWEKAGFQCSSKDIMVHQDSLEDARPAKKSKKEECRGCRKNFTRRTVKKHLKEGCPKKKEKHRERNCKK